MIVLKTEEWHEDDGDCLFFHFDDWDSSPQVTCANPLDNVFNEDFWTHFIKDFDFNQLFEKAEELDGSK